MWSTEHSTPSPWQHTSHNNHMGMSVHKIHEQYSSKLDFHITAVRTITRVLIYTHYQYRNVGVRMCVGLQLFTAMVQDHVTVT